MRQPCFRGETPSNCFELPVAQRTDQVTRDCDLVSVTSGKPLLCQGIDPPIKRGADFSTETGARKLGRLSGDQAPVEPGRPFGCHLLVEVKVRADRQRDPLPTPRIVKTTQFHNAADGTVTGHVDVGKLEVVDAPIDFVDDGKRRAPQFIVKAAGNETADDRFAVGLAFERPAGWRARCSVFCERLMQPLDDVATFSERTQPLLGVRRQNPARRTSRLGESQPLKRPHATNPNLPPRIACSIAFGTKINHPLRPSRFPGERPIELCPAFCGHFRVKATPNLQLGS